MDPVFKVVACSKIFISYSYLGSNCKTQVNANSEECYITKRVFHGTIEGLPYYIQLKIWSMYSIIKMNEPREFFNAMLWSAGRNMRTRKGTAKRKLITFTLCSVELGMKPRKVTVANSKWQSIYAAGENTLDLSSMVKYETYHCLWNFLIICSLSQR